MFVVDISQNYKEQYIITTQDPYALYSAGIKTTTDGTIVEGLKIIEICSELSKYGNVDLTEQAYEQMQKDNNLKDIKLEHFVSKKIPKNFQKKGYWRSQGKDAFVYVWTPGTGKSLAGTLEICRAIDKEGFDLAIVIPSAPLLPQWEEMLKEDTSLKIGSVHRYRTKQKRLEFYKEQNDVYVINYDKFAIAEDAKEIEKMCKNKKVILVMDETHKIKTRKRNNKAIKKFCNHIKPAKIIGLTATPIESSLLDWYNQMRVFKPEIYGTVKDFENAYTVNFGMKDIFNRYYGFQNFEDCRLKTAYMVDYADKNSDPKIAAEFPDKNEIQIPIELSHFERKLYDEIVNYGRLLGEERSGAIFMQYLQRLCNMPETILESESTNEQGQRIIEIAQKYATHLQKSKESEKLRRLAALIDELLENAGKIVVFAHYTNICLEQLNNYFKNKNPLMYHGGMSAKEENETIKEFKENPTRRLLFLSDAAAEGINLPQANSLIHYDTPAQYSKYLQRSDRISRIDSNYKTIDVYRFVTKNTVEENIETLMSERKELAQNMGFLSEEEAALKKIDIDEMSGGYDYLLGF